MDNKIFARNLNRLLMMNTYRYQTNCDGIDWMRIPELLEEGGMSFSDAQVHKKSFEVSHSVLFVFDEDRIIGCGRLLSDGVRQSAIYDIVVDPAYQGQKLGQKIIDKLVETTPNCNFILYASPGKEGFYERLGFKKMKTGMALFADPVRMTDGVFVEP